MSNIAHDGITDAEQLDLFEDDLNAELGAAVAPAICRNVAIGDYRPEKDADRIEWAITALEALTGKYEDAWRGQKSAVLAMFCAAQPREQRAAAAALLARIEAEISEFRNKEAA